MVHILRGTPEAGHVDERLQQWRQGDFVIGEIQFPIQIHPNHTALSEIPTDFFDEVGEKTEPQVLTLSFPGAVVISQTCDVVRECTLENRSFVQIAALQDRGRDTLEKAKGGLTPQYVFIPGAESLGLVANLELMTLVEKPLLVSWEQHQGCFTDDQRRLLADSLARHRARPAFPSDFSDFTVRALQDRMKKRHGSNAPIGVGTTEQKRAALEAHAVRSLREIRVAARPSWGDPQKITLFFIRKNPADGISEEEWQGFRAEWKTLLAPRGVFQNFETAIVQLAELTAQEYTESDRLDLDYLSNEPE